MPSKAFQGTGALALIEPFAALGGGHWATALPQLVGASVAKGRPCAVICLDGIHKQTHRRVLDAGARLIQSRDVQSSRARRMIAIAALLRRWHVVMHAKFPASAGPFQLLHFSRCFLEAASLITVNEALSGQPCTVVLTTANETLHGSTCSLARTTHVRVVHEVDCHEGRLIRAVELGTRSALRYARFVCPTETVADRLTARAPTVKPRVHRFAMRDAGLYLTEGERRTARRALGLSEEKIVGSVIGGWWKSKDIRTLLEGLRRSRNPFWLLIAGAPLDGNQLKALRETVDHRVLVIERPLSAAELRSVHAASDFTIVSRVADGTESGVVFDCLQFGTPLVCSDHDPWLNRVLHDERWARLFAAAEPVSLAATLDGICVNPLTRPPRTAVDRIGLCDPESQLDFFDSAMDAGPR